MSNELRDGITVVEVEYPGTRLDGFAAHTRFELGGLLRAPSRTR